MTKPHAVFSFFAAMSLAGLAWPIAADSAAAGTGKCGQAVYKDRTDPDYRTVLQMVESAVGKAWDRPRRDLRALVRK